MSLERRRQIEEIFQTALGLDALAREEFLAESCADEAVREEVEKLLTTGGGETGEGARAAEDRELDRMVGREIGVYRLLREIGRGGMGAVYLAERADAEFSKQVAVKLIKRGMDTDLVVRRFRNERQILATLNHPFITRLIDGGTTRSGLPFFVMEFVEGAPLYQYCENQNLSLTEKLEIFQKICEAVAEAHQYKIVHRDLKPSNILVKADGTPKLLDFGIAKLLDPEIGAVTMDPTATHMRMMTPRYASPEQISGETVSPASDVYSLGVLLYELVTGKSPYRTKSRSPFQIARAVLEEEPLKPKLAKPKADRSVPPASAGGFNAETEERIGADLELIILKSLRKDPSERYASAAELAADVKNYLEGRAVAAQSFDQKPEKSSAAAEELNRKSLAVLPFKLLGDATGKEAGDEYLSVGLADALISRLSGVKRLVVRPTSSVLRFHDAPDVVEAGRDLNVEFVVEGAIRVVGERFRASIRLLSVEKRSTVWAGNFDERFTDFLQLEDSVSERVVKTLLSQLTGEEEKRLHKRGTNSPAAYEAYVRGRHFANQFKEDSLQKAVEAYREAVRLDPAYALPYVGIADFYVLATLIGVIPPREGYPLAKEELRRALQADDALAEAYALAGFIALLYDWNWAEAERLVERSLEINPNYYLAHDVKAHILASQGIPAAAIEEIEISERLDPLSPRAKVMTACILYQTRYFERGAAKAEKALEMQPGAPPAMFHFGGALTHAGRAARAIEILSESSRLWENSAVPKYALCHALVAAGRRDEARRLLGEMLAAAETQYVKPYFVAMAWAALDETDAAFEWFEKSIEQRDDWMIWFGTDIKLDALRRDARYFEILKKTNNPIFALLSPAAQLRDATTGSREKTVAVLPFKMIGTREMDDEYLSVGLVDALITRLSKVRRLIVRPTSSVLRFGETTDALAVGDRLGVEFIVDGSIRRAGERIRVTAQLLNVDENSTVWSESFDEKFTDVLELEDSLSEKVAESLIPRLTGEEKRQLHRRGTNSPEAYEAYLRGRFYWNLQTEEGFARAIGYYQQAVRLDPDYAPAYAAIAEYYIFIGIHCVIPFAQGSLAAREAAEKAVELDPTSAEGYAALGFAAISFELDWEKAEKLFLRAVELNANSITAHFWYVAVLAQSARFDAALKQLERVTELDPGSLLASHMKAWVLYHARAFEKSIAMYEKMLEAEPNYPWGLQTYSWVLRRRGRFSEAIAQAEKAVQLTGENPFYLTALAAAYAEAGEREKALELLTKLDEMAQTRFVSEYMLALVYCALGDRDRAFENLEKSLAARDGWTNWLGVEPQFDILRSDPRFEDLLRRSGNTLAKIKNETAEKSIAVLPFKLLGTAGNTGEEEYLGIGLADALTTRLSNVRRLFVRPTSSVLPFAESMVSPFQAGRQLGVDFVLDGSVRRLGERIRVTVQLLSVGENASRWAENFDEKFTDILELEDSISAKAVKSLLTKFSAEEQSRLEKRGTNDARAYEFYLRGRFHWNQFTPDALLKSRDAFQKAIESDPNYALAFVGLCDFYIWANIYGLVPSAEALPLAESCALRAIELDDKLGEAYASLGLTHQNRFGWKKAEGLYRKALELSPNYVHAHEWWAAQLVGHGDFEEGVREIRVAERLDPLSLRTKTLVAWTLYQARRFTEALEVARQIADLDKNYPQGYAQLGNNLLRLGETGEAVANFQKFDAMIPNSGLAKYVLCHALAAAGREREAREVLREIETLAAEGYVKPYFLGMAYAALNARDEAFANFEKAFGESDPWMLWFGTEPMLDNLRDDARFDDLLRRMNIPRSVK